MAFPQTGQLDWVSLASRCVEAPIGILGRLSQAGIDPYTLEIVKAFGSKFTILDSYLDDVEGKLRSTQRYGLYADMLFFGTGISVLPLLLSKTRGAVAFTAVTMALRASFDASYTARVLAEMLRLFCPNDVIIPAVNQFEALGNEVASAVRDEGLGKLIWGMEITWMKLEGWSEPGSPGDPAPPSVQEMATLILALSTLPPGQDIHIRSTSPCLWWVAAFAHRLAGLHICLQTPSRIIFESSVVTSAGSQSRGTARILIQAEPSATGLGQWPSNSDTHIELFRTAQVECSINRREDGVSTSSRVPVADAVEWLLNNLSVVAEQRSLAIQCIAEAICQIEGCPIVWEHKNHNNVKPKVGNITSPAPAPKIAPREEARFLRTTDDIIRACKSMDPTTIVRLPKSIRDFEKKSRCVGSGGRNDLMHTLLDRGFWEQFDTFNQLGCSSPNSLDCLLSLFCVLISLLFVKSDVGLDLDHRALFEIGYRPRRFLTSVFPDYSGSYLRYNETLEEIFRLVIGLGVTEDGRDVAALSNGGSYAVMSTVLEVDQHILDITRIIFGKGGIFVNGKGVSKLQSFRTLRQKEYITVDALDRHSVRKSCYLHTLPMTDSSQLSFALNIQARELPGSIQIAWSVTAREGIDMVIDVLISPHEIVEAELAVIHPLQHCSEAIQSHDSNFEVVVRNIEAYICDSQRLTIGETERSVVQCHGNSAARLLAVFLGSGKLKVKPSPGTFLIRCTEFIRGGGCVILV